MTRTSLHEPEIYSSNFAGKILSQLACQIRSNTTHVKFRLLDIDILIFKKKFIMFIFNSFCNYSNTFSPLLVDLLYISYEFSHRELAFRDIDEVRSKAMVMCEQC